MSRGRGYAQRNAYRTKPHAFSQYRSHKTGAAYATAKRNEMAWWQPDAEVRRLTDIPLERLDALVGARIRGVIVDLDNTVCAYGEPRVAPGVAAWIAQARSRGLRCVVVSNNFTERVASIGAALEIPYVPNALKPLPPAFLRALRLLGTRPAETVVIGDQLFTDVLGGKLLGLRAILTHPIIDRDFPITRILRRCEYLLGRRLPRA